jgi:ABC-2 type transport system permease protein/sodium transport system permease protein
MSMVGLSLVVRLARKELREILRDRRTIITLVVMPILLYPLLSIAFRQYFLTAVAPTTVTTYRVATQDQEQALLFRQHLRHGAADPSEKETEFTFFESDDIEKSVVNEDVDLGVRRGDSGQNWEILVRSDSPLGKKALTEAMTRLSTANLRILQGERRRRGGPATLPIPVEVKEVTVQQTEAKKPSMLASLIPLILVLMTITGAVYPAIDLTAGERERGTLEILIAAPIPRMGVLLGKYAAVLTVAMLTGVVNLGMMMVTLLASKLTPIVFGEGGLSVGTILAILALLLLFAMFFSAVLLAVTSFARSFKEAQAYLIPLMLASITPGMLALMPNMQLGGLLTVTPLLNIVLLAKEILGGGAPATQAAIVVVSTLLYAFLAIGVAARLFGAEAVLYSEQSQLFDLLRRPAHPQKVPTLTMAMGCLALAFPLSILIGDSLSSLHVEQEMRLILSIVASAAVFAGLPLLAAWLTRLRPATGFQLRAAALPAFAGAVVLGFSLWPVVAELIVLEHKAGLTTLPQWLQDKLRELTEQRRETSPLLVLLALAVVPGVVEELFFRGFLFNGILSKGNALQAMLLSTLLFALFHVFTGGVLTIERFLPTALLGLILGTIRWQSGSVWPGMVLHVVHNGVIVSLSLLPDLFGGRAAELEGANHVPVLWLGCSALGVAMGALLIWWGRRRQTPAV